MKYAFGCLNNKHPLSKVSPAPERRFQQNLAGVLPRVQQTESSANREFSKHTFL
jgi:hypothetical protein